MDENKNNLGRGEKQRGALKNASVILACGIVVLAGLHCARGILGTIFISAFFSVLLISPVRWLRSKGFSQWLSLTVVIVGVLAAGLLTMTIVGAQLTQFAKNIPTYRDRFNETLMNYDLNVGDFVPFLKSDEPAEKPDASGETEEADDDALAFKRFQEYERAQRERKNDANANGLRETSGATGDERSGGAATRRTSRDVAELTPVAWSVPADSAENGAYGESIDDAETPGLIPASSGSDGLLTGASNADQDRLIPANPVQNERLTPSTPKETTTGTPSGSVATNEFDDATSDDATSDGATSDGESTEIATADETAETLGPEIGAAKTLGDEANADEETAEAGGESFFNRKTRETAVDASSKQLFRFLSGLAGELSYFASNAFIITLLVVFMMCEMASTPKKLAAAFGKRRFVDDRIQGVVEDIRNYMVIKTWMSIGVGVSVTLLLVVSKVEYPILWGFVAFLLNYIPNIGSVAAAIPPIVLATVEHGLVVGGVDAIFFVIINCGIGYGIEPRLLGNGLNLSPLIVLISLILFGWILGPIGMFLSPPLAVIMKIIFQSFPETRWIAALMANGSPKEEDEPDDRSGGEPSEASV